MRGSKNEDSFSTVFDTMMVQFQFSLPCHNHLHFGGFDLLVSMGTTGPTVRVPGMADCTLRSELLNDEANVLLPHAHYAGYGAIMARAGACTG